MDKNVTTPKPQPLSHRDRHIQVLQERLGVGDTEVRLRASTPEGDYELAFDMPIAELWLFVTDKFIIN